MAVGSILLITSFADTTYGLTLEPLQLALWAIPTAVVALVVHGARMLLLDRTLTRLQRGPTADGTDETAAEVAR